MTDAVEEAYARGYVDGLIAAYDESEHFLLDLSAQVPPKLIPFSDLFCTLIKAFKAKREKIVLLGRTGSTEIN